MLMFEIMKLIHMPSRWFGEKEKKEERRIDQLSQFNENC